MDGRATWWAEQWLRLWIFLSLCPPLVSCHLSLSFCISLFDSACLSALRFSEGLPFLLLGIFIYFLSWYSFIIQSVLLHLFICASAHICAHSSINPVVYLLYPSISPSISSISQRYIYIFIYLSIKKNHVFSHLSPCLSLSLSRDVETYNVLWKSDPSAMQQAPFCTSRLEPNVTWSQSHEEVSLTAEMHLRLNVPPFEWLSRKWPSEPTVRGARPVSHIGRAKRKLMRTLERKAPWIRIACRKTRDLC